MACRGLSLSPKWGFFHQAEAKTFLRLRRADIVPPVMLLNEAEDFTNFPI